VYTTRIDVGAATAYSVTSLPPGSTNYFAVAAYDASGFESVRSNEVKAVEPSGAPVASFTASTTSGVAPLSLNFTNLSTGSITSYAWTFGDGTSSTSANPAKAYTLPGVYTVSLKATGPGGSNTQTKTNYITVTAASTSGTGSKIAFVQTNNATPQGSAPTVQVPFKSAQSAGNLNVVIVGWEDLTSTVASVTDSMGNVYVKAVGPNSGARTSQSIYYAKNIKAAGANANTVTVKLSGPAQYPDIRVVEYSGVDPVNPVDKVAAGAGNSALASTSSVTTSQANTLLFASTMVWTHITGPGSGFTQRAMTYDGNIVEDRILSATGSYNATAPMTSGDWVIQMVAFRAAP
jgi:PKD repeat protein